jgi:hypothetical protein
MDKYHKTMLPDGWEVVVARNLAEVESLRHVWEKLQNEETSPVPNADIDRFISVIEPLRDTVQPCIMLLRYNGNPKAMAIGRVERIKLNCRIGYKTLLRPTLKCLTIVYGGLIGKLTDEALSILLQELLRTLAKREADVVVFNHLKTHSPIYHFVRTIPNFLCRGHFPVVQPHWKTSLPDSYQEFLRSRSKNTRHNIRRYSQRLSDKYGERLSIRRFTTADQLDELFADMVEVARKTYQYGLGAAFVDDRKTRSQMKLLADQKWLYALVLYIDGKPRAFWNGARYHKTFFTLATGYDPAYSEDRLGMLLLTHVFEDMCSDENIDAVDFGFGDADYKHGYGNEHWMEASVHIFAPRLYPAFINILRTSVTGLTLALKYIFQKFGSAGWIKRRWRNLLQKNNKG